MFTALRTTAQHYLYKFFRIFSTISSTKGAALAAAALCLGMSSQTHASTVMQVSFAEVVEHAELIFEGRVISTEARWSAPRVIHTHIVFEVLDVLKGEYSEDTIELRFLGGTVDGQRLQVTDMLVPAEGETGFYFVESMASEQVHPLVGWAQGHYVIHEDAGGVHRVTTAENQPIQEIEQQGEAQLQVMQSRKLSEGVAKGVIVKEFSELRQTLSVDSFKASIREVLSREALSSR